MWPFDPRRVQLQQSALATRLRVWKSRQAERAFRRVAAKQPMKPNGRGREKKEDERRKRSQAQQHYQFEQKLSLSATKTNKDKSNKEDTMKQFEAKHTMLKASSVMGNNQ